MSVHLPTVNACLNAFAAVFLFLGWWAIRQRRERRHIAFMATALAASGLFLTTYLYYHYHAGSVPYEGTGVLRTLYLIILIPHVILAAAMVPFILMAVYFGIRDKRSAHARLTKWVWPVWMYVSVSGVLVYLMLYVLPHGG